MENKCLITTLQGEMSGQNLPKFGDLKVSAKWAGNSVIFYYGPGNPNNGDKLDDDIIVDIIEGGTIDGETTVTIPKGTVSNQYASLTITKADGASDLVIIVNNQYTLNGFGFSNYIRDIMLSQSDFEKFVNINKFTLVNRYETTFNLTNLVEGLYKNGWRKSSASIYCYTDFDYALYSGDTHVSTSSQLLTVAFNEGMTEYTLSINSNVIAKRKLVEGVWVSQPTM